MTYIYSDGGRAEAGYKGTAADCAVRAIAIVLDLPYKAIYEDMRYFMDCRDAGSPRNGITEEHLRRYLGERGFRYVAAKINGKHTNMHLNRAELPAGRIIANLSNHVSAVIDGVLHDTWDCSDGGETPVYGYWKKVS